MADTPQGQTQVTVVSQETELQKIWSDAGKAWGWVVKEMTPVLTTAEGVLEPLAEKLIVDMGIAWLDHIAAKNHVNLGGGA